jgi:hypothetical protein
MATLDELCNHYLYGEEIYYPEVDFSKIYERDNITLLELLINSEVLYLDSKMLFHALEFDSINIFNYLFASKDPEFMDFDYDVYIQMAIHINAFKIFKKLVEFYKSEGISLRFIETYSIKHAALHNNLEMFQILYKNKADITQPVIYKYALSGDCYEIVDYLDSFYIIRDDLDNSDSDSDDDDNSNCICDLHYYNNGLNEQNETLLNERTSNSIDVINALKQLDIPYEILEKIIIHTQDFYLIMAFNQNLAKFMYFPETYFREDYELNEYSTTRYIKVIPEDNLIAGLYEMVITMIYRNNIPLFRFLHGLYTQLDFDDNDEYGRDNFISLSIELNHIEIFDFLLDYHVDNDISIKIRECNLQLASRHNNPQMFKILHQNGIKVKHESVIEIAKKNKCYELLDYLESIYYATCPCCDTINEYDSDDTT